MAPTEHATVIFRDRTPSEAPGMSRVQAGRQLTERHKDKLVAWVRHHGRAADLNVGEATALGAVEVRASADLLREIERLPDVEMVLRD